MLVTRPPYQPPYWRHDLEVLTLVDSDGDDEALIARAWRGDEGALETVIRRYKGLVRTKARTYFLAGGDREDVVQEGMIGLYKAVRDFDAGREVSFRTFADLCIRRQIITAVKAATRQKHAPLNLSISLSVRGGDDGSDGDALDVLLVEADDPADRVVSKDELTVLEKYCCQTLTPLEREVLRRYLDGERYAEIAIAVGRGTKAIDNALQRIKRKVEAYLADRAIEPAV